MILDLDDIGKGNKVERAISSSSLRIPLCLQSRNTPTNNPPQGIIKKIIFTTTEITIYPNGQIFPGKTQSWIKGAVYKPKVKKKSTKKVKKVMMKKEEVY